MRRERQAKCGRDDGRPPGHDVQPDEDEPHTEDTDERRRRQRPRSAPLEAGIGQVVLQVQVGVEELIVDVVRALVRLGVGVLSGHRHGPRHRRLRPEGGDVLLGARQRRPGLEERPCGLRHRLGMDDDAGRRRDPLLEDVGSAVLGAVADPCRPHQVLGDPAELIDLVVGQRRLGGGRGPDGLGAGHHVAIVGATARLVGGDRSPPGIDPLAHGALGRRSVVDQFGIELLGELRGRDRRVGGEDDTQAGSTAVRSVRQARSLPVCATVVPTRDGVGILAQRAMT